MNEKQWLKKAIQVILSQDKSDVEKAEEIIEMIECNKPTVNKEIFNKVMYALTKNAARSSFVDFLDIWEVPEEEYDKIRKYLKETYGIKTYV
jgi:hypothetical protein